VTQSLAANFDIISLYESDDSSERGNMLCRSEGKRSRVSFRINKAAEIVCGPVCYKEDAAEWNLNWNTPTVSLDVDF
jgi:hypothetical protein